VIKKKQRYVIAVIDYDRPIYYEYEDESLTSHWVYELDRATKLKYRAALQVYVRQQGGNELVKMLTVAEAEVQRIMVS
jgi:hypothetical protein